VVISTDFELSLTDLSYVFMRGAELLGGGDEVTLFLAPPLLVVFLFCFVFFGLALFLDAPPPLATLFFLWLWLLASFLKFPLWALCSFQTPAWWFVN
jgi:hypothetical protein